MPSTSNNIQLSASAIQSIVSLCETIQSKNPRNEISMNMARGISDFAKSNGFVTLAQSRWICRNADFWKISRPAGLEDVTFNETPLRQQQTETEVTKGSNENEIAYQLKRIATLLETRMPLAPQPLR